MSTTQQPSRTRSLGASLLDQVLAETVDPAYARAAEARADRPAPTRGARWRGQALVAVTMVLAGLLAALTYDQASAGSEGRQEIRAALIADIDRESGVTDDLVTALAELQAEVGTARDQALSVSAGGQLALDQLARQEAGAATGPVRGPGLTVTLGNALPSADDDPVAGPPPPTARSPRSSTATCSCWSTRCGPRARRRSASAGSGWARRPPSGRPAGPSWSTSGR